MQIQPRLYSQLYCCVLSQINNYQMQKCDEIKKKLKKLQWQQQTLQRRLKVATQQNISKLSVIQHRSITPNCDPTQVYCPKL